MTDSLVRLGSMWQPVVIVALLIIIVVAIVLWRVIRASREESEAAQAPASAKAANGEAAGGDRSTPHTPARLSAIALTLSFRRAVRFLKGHVSGKDYRYEVPWYIVLGAPGSGKTTFLESGGYRVTFDDVGAGESTADLLEWRFFDQGILLGTPGELLEGPAETPAIATGWNRLLRLLQRHRPRRPLDGIILTISTADLVGPGALTESQLAARGARINSLLATAQKVVGFTFPVYVVVTQCDRVAGFSAFCRELPPHTHQQMFGWSCPYHVDAAFSAASIDEAFHTVQQEVRLTQGEIFLEKTHLERADDVFLFPEELVRLRQPLRVHLENIFRETAYRESIQLRGIYFTGDIDAYAPPAAEVATAATPEDDLMLPGLMPEETPAQDVTPPARSLLFVRDLLERKIFPESGLARPLSRVFLSRNRMVLAIQLFSAALALFLFLGLFFAFRRLSVDRSQLLPMLREIQIMDRTPESARHNLLITMAGAGKASFRSPFLPGSLLSGLDGEVTRVMTEACNQFVLTNLQNALSKRLIDIVDRNSNLARPEQRKPDEDAPVALSIEATEEYRTLNRFIGELRTYRDNVEVYDNLRQFGRLEDIRRIQRLVQYLFNAQLADFEPDGHLARALEAAYGQPLAVSPQNRERASAVLEQMIDRIYERWFTKSPLLADLEDIKVRCADLEQSKAAGYEDLRELLDAIKETDSHFSATGFKWSLSQKFDLAGEFRKIIQEPITLQQTVLVDTQLLQYASRQGEEYQAQLRATLLRQNSPMTGPMVADGDPIKLAGGMRALALALENALNLRFMADEQTKPIRTNLDKQTRLLWRVEPLQDALRLHDIYNRFREEGLKDTPPRLRSALSRVAVQRLAANVEGLIAQAQDVQVTSLSQSQLGGEGETLVEVNSFREALEPLLQLVNLSRQTGLTDTQNRLLRVMTQQSLNVLEILDRKLNDEDAYASRGGNFGWWNGKDQLSLAAFEVRTSAELADYLTGQRDRLKFLAQQSEPFVRFLDAWMPTRGENQSRLISKWQTLVADFRQYDGKKPGASLTALEEFILNDMDKIVPATGCPGGAVREVREQRVDYFLQIRGRLRRAVAERCEILAAEATYQAYAEIAEAFNRTLAGKFPFAPLTADKVQEEATPEALLEFFKLLDQNGKAARATLKDNARLGSSREQALAFLDNMEQLRPLVVSAAADAEKEPPLSFDFSPKFRVMTGSESGGNQIIDWTLQVGGQIFRSTEPEHPGRWRFGNPVRLSLRWAKDSPGVPVADIRQPNLRIIERNAFFEFTNRWSLLSFIRRQEAILADVGKSSEFRPYTLRFRLKMAPDTKWMDAGVAEVIPDTLVFVQVRLFAPGGKTAITLPFFPVKAPPLDRPTVVTR